MGFGVLIYAALGFAAAAIGALGTALALAMRIGGLKTDIGDLKFEIGELEQNIETATEELGNYAAREGRLNATITDLEGRIRASREELERLAIPGTGAARFARLLSGEKAADDN